MAALGRDDDALVLYRAWVAEQPQDRRAGYELGCLLEDMGQEEAAMEAFDAFVQRFPSDAGGVKKLAEARLRAGQPEKALELYHRLAERDHDHHTLESYAMLAESLDEHEALFRALKLTVARQPQPSVELYLDFAEAASHLEDSRILMDVLSQGIERLPESAALRVALANAWLASDGYDEAFALLTGQEKMRQNIDAVALALALAPRLPDPRRVLEFVGEDADRRFPLPPGSRLDLAVLHRLAGDEDKAEALVASVPETMENRRMIAEARSHMGDHEEAARQMVAYLDSNARASASEWIFLGEIYEQMGRLEDAKKAFDYSLALLTADLPDTAFTQPGGAGAASP
jgi:tetratricopeptide (TPR) repeat protein